MYHCRYHCILPALFSSLHPLVSRMIYSYVFTVSRCFFLTALVFLCLSFWHILAWIALSSLPLYSLVFLCLFRLSYVWSTYCINTSSLSFMFSREEGAHNLARIALWTIPQRPLNLLSILSRVCIRPTSHESMPSLGRSSSYTLEFLPRPLRVFHTAERSKELSKSPGESRG